MLPWRSPTRSTNRVASSRKAGFPEYWLFDIETRTVELYRAPDGLDAYRERRIATSAEALAIPGTDACLDLAALFALL